MCNASPPPGGMNKVAYGDPNGDPANRVSSTTQPLAAPGTTTANPVDRDPTSTQNTFNDGAPGTIDYSRFKGVSPLQVYTSFTNGLPPNWSWDQWMNANPGAQDPRNHTHSGDLITPGQLAQWQNPVQTTPPPTNTPPPPSNPGEPTKPPVTTVAQAPPVTIPNPGPLKPPVTPPVAKVATSPVDTVLPAATASSSSGAFPGSQVFNGVPGSGGAGGTNYRVDAAYSPGVTSLADTPVGSITNALLRRVKSPY